MQHAKVLPLHCHPGHCYIAGMSTAEHQVVHELSGTEERPRMPPFEDPVEVALVVRCSLFRHEKGLQGRPIYRPLQAALCRWFETCTLRLPTLAECRAQMPPGPPERLRLRRKRPASEGAAAA